MKAKAVSAIFLLALVGCPNPINQRTAENYYQWGIDAELSGNYPLAERNYERALINAELGHSPDSGKSAAMYGLGRMKGYLCKRSDAETLLVKALLLEEKVSGPGSGVTTMRVFELARLHFDQGQYTASLPYFGRGIPAVKKLGVETSDPIALADTLDDYATALAKLQQETDAARIRTEANELRQRNPGATARFVPVRYPQRCPTA